VLACQWIEQRLGPVTMEFGKLLKRLVEPGALQSEIVSLLDQKRRGLELDIGPRLPAIHAFLEQELARLANAHGFPNAETTAIEPLDELFRWVLRQIDAAQPS
jgi:predicted nucleotidyltransferase